MTQPVVLNLDTEPAPSGASDTPSVPSEAEYRPARDREKVRTKLALGLAIVTSVIGLTLLICGLATTHPIEALLTGIFTPFFGLTGTVIGFYFGGQDATRG